MRSKVYFSDFKIRNQERDAKIYKIDRLCQAAGMGELISKGDLTAVKLHFGEKGNEGYINPVFVRRVVDQIRALSAEPFLTDTNTLYVGERQDAVHHLKLAVEHGFDYAVVNAPLVIADGLKGDNYREIPLKSKHYSSVRIANDILAADSMVVLSHFKGHPIAGFGGALKNLAMGCAPAAGKKQQHQEKPFYDQSKCIGCEACRRQCAFEAPYLKDGKAYLDCSLCVGCGKCVSVCPVHAISMDSPTQSGAFLERLVEYAKGAVENKKGKVFYVNFLMKITPLCDCFVFSNEPVTNDIGILASNDPVAVDKACFDLLEKQMGRDVFHELTPHVPALRQITYGEEIGLGSSNYELIEVH